MDESLKKKVDESWKEQAEREKQVVGAQASQAPSKPTPSPEEEPAAPEGVPQARFDLFISGLAMETLVALGDLAHPTTRKQATQLPQAKYLIDLLGIMEQKTAGNLSVDEEKLLKDTLYQLRMRYLAKAGQ